MFQFQTMEGRARSRVSSREKCWSDWRLLLSDTPPNQQQQQQLSIGQGLKAMCICSFSLSNYNNSNNDREFESVSSNSEFVPPLTWTSFQKATTLSLCYLVGGELCRTPELQALCRLLYISGICISLDLSRYAHDYAASILQKTSFLNKDRVQRNRDVIYNLMSGNVFESLQSPHLPSKLGVASVRHLCKWRSCWGAQCTHREHRGTPSMLYNWGTAPILYCWGTPLMPYKWEHPRCSTIGEHPRRRTQSISLPPVRGKWGKPGQEESILVSEHPATICA